MNDPTPTFDPLDLLTVREAGELLPVSRPTLEGLMKSGELPSVQIGRCRRVRRTDLEAVLTRRTAYGWKPYRPDPAWAPQPAGSGAGGSPVPF